MTQQTPYPPAPHAPQAPPTPPAPRNGLGTAGFVLGLVGLVFSPIPIIGVIAWPLVVLGLVFSAVGLSLVGKGKATNKGLSIAGIIVSVLGLVVSIVVAVLVNKAVTEVTDEVNRTASVTYEVTGDAKNVEIIYGEVLNPSTETVASLPWNKQVENKGVYKGGTLTISTDENGGSVSCKITVDGAVVSTKTGTGEPFSTVACTGS
ncbi:DUF4190 domain-containing protein [Amycolatopsis nigrescens]|uniref:DUF4190 domain-containing protein n=1 Tax=Amycolatopsis nigrescens TaxID=381445 RepID=UPI00037338EB|nr:DUF4190 domain-containing protein [Amycolatopsis nigrescens]